MDRQQHQSQDGGKQTMLLSERDPEAQLRWIDEVRQDQAQHHRDPLPIRVRLWTNLYDWGELAEAGVKGKWRRRPLYVSDKRPGQYCEFESIEQVERFYAALTLFADGVRRRGPDAVCEVLEEL